MSSFRPVCFFLLTTFIVYLLPATEGRSQSVNLPKDFFVERVQGSACSRYFSAGRLGGDLKYIAGIPSAKIKSTNSLTVNHNHLSTRWTRLLGVSTGAAARNDVVSAQRIIAQLVDFANRNALLDTVSLSTAKRTNCWAGGNPNAICPRHEVEFTGQAAVAIIYSAILLEEYMQPAQRAALDKYFEKLNKKFIAPLAKDGVNGGGLYSFADYGLGVLAYARWTGNKRLAASELRKRRAALSKKIANDGMIKENSYRGYRGYWYHTYGAESALGYALVARSFGRDFFRDPKIGPKLQMVAQQTAIGGANYQEFLRRSLTGKSENVIRDKSAERPHMHQLAVSLPLIVRNEYGIRVRTAPAYRSKGSSETIGQIIGFNAECYYSSR